jgi:AraC-like DNA-binding protein
MASAMTENPEFLTNRSSEGGCPEDYLSDYLRAIHLSGGVFFHSWCSRPFSIATPSREQVAVMLRLGTRRVVPFHLIIKGACEARIPGLNPVSLAAGDVVVFPLDASHVMASVGTRGAATPIAPLLPPPPYDRIRPMRHGGGGSVTEVICGFLHYDDSRFNPLMTSLPKVITVRGGWDNRTLPLSQILQLIEDESRHPRPGRACLLARLTELMFVEVLRRYIEELPQGNGGWLAGYADPFVGRILHLFHSQLDRNWTFDSLCTEVGLSRTAVANRFKRTVGESPMRYLALLRMQRATELLRETDAKVAAVAARVGYRSELGFHRAFRRIVGIPPATWRRNNAGLM